MYGFEKGDYVVSSHEDFYGETFVVLGFTHSLFGEPLIEVARPSAPRERNTMFYPRELVTEDKFDFSWND